MSGDTKQIQSVESCDALRVLEKEFRLKTVALIQVRRQTEQPYREAIQELRQKSGASASNGWMPSERCVRSPGWNARRQSHQPLLNSDLKDDRRLWCVQHMGRSIGF